MRNVSLILNLAFKHVRGCSSYVKYEWVFSEQIQLIIEWIMKMLRDVNDERQKKMLSVESCLLSTMKRKVPTWKIWIKAEIYIIIIKQVQSAPAEVGPLFTHFTLSHVRMLSAV